MEKTLVVGAGLSGATIARLFAENGEDVIVIDKRTNIGGNVYDYQDKNGIMVQAYGPHIFHTKMKEVFDFLSRFTEWNKYEHKVLARIRKDKFVPVPFNLSSLEKSFSKEKAEKIKKLLIEEFGENQQVAIYKLKEHQNPDIKEFGEFVYKRIFYLYTIKQWGCKPEQLDKSVVERVKINVSYEDRYFTDEYQYMPQRGFTEMVANILRHPRIQLKLGMDAKKEIALSDGKIYLSGKPFEGRVVYTGCVDELFDYQYGVLPYRSLKFKFKTLKKKSYQASAVVNFTTSHKFTRITEFTKFTCSPTDSTVIVKEIPKPFKKGKNIPYYPIPTKKNEEHYNRYKELASGYKDLYLLGRLANYKYINMDVAVKNAMNLFEDISGVAVSDLD